MKKISILLLVIVTALASCKKVPEVNKEYVDVERDLITVGTTTATIQCDYEYIATLKKAFLYYGEGEDATDMNVAEMSVVQKTLYVELAGLKENTTYSYYYEFVNGFNSMKSATKAFKTEASTTTVTLPTVVTAEVTEITANSAKGGGEVTNDGGAEVTERGICWSTNANPTLNGNHIASGAGTGAFAVLLSGLEANTTYHVRAYATNEKGTAYGLDKEFTTLGGGSGAPEGAINGLFSVSPTKKVYFSQGNLQYQASTNTWRFAENQWNYVGTQIAGTWWWGATGGNVEGSDNIDIAAFYDGWIDLFGWGTSGFNHGAMCYQPWGTSGQSGDYAAYGNDSCNLYDWTSQADWGFNAICNGGNQLGQWRTMTKDEWNYVLNLRNTNSEGRYTGGVVNGVNGLILLPDDWNSSLYNLNNLNQTSVVFNDNFISNEEWSSVFQMNGAVFLPASGYRVCVINGIYVDGVNIVGTYWTSTSTNQYSVLSAYGISFSEVMELHIDDGLYRSNGESVRLVQDANP